MALTQIGPLTNALEAVATAIGAGAIFCAAAAGVAGLAQGWPRRDIENGAAVGGYVGGGIGAAFALADVILRYGIAK
jgi:hypothetical protein